MLKGGHGKAFDVNFPHALGLCVCVRVCVVVCGCEAVCVCWCVCVLVHILINLTVKDSKWPQYLSFALFVK